MIRLPAIRNAARIFVGPLITAATIVAVVLLQRRAVAIPNPAVLYVCTIILATGIGGWPSGLISGAIALGYALVFFSSPGHLFHYTPDNLSRIAVLFVGTPLAILLTGILKTQTSRALAREHAAREAVEVQDSELRTLRSALDKIDHGVVLLDGELRAEFINRAFRKTWHVPDAVADARPAFVGLMYHGRNTKAYAMPDHQLDPYVAERMAQVQARHDTTRDIRLANGEVLRFNCKMLDDDRRLLTYTNVTDIVRHGDELERLRAALDHVDYGIMLLDRNLHIEFANQCLRQLTQIPEELVVGRPHYSELFHHSRGASIWNVPENQFDSYALERLATVRSGNGAPHDLRLTNGRILRSQCTALPDGGRMISYTDVTEQVQHTEQLEELATIDHLTGLCNRRQFLALAEAEWSRFRRYERPLCLLMIDIDLFKSVNDRFGHDTGDAMLAHIATLCAHGKRDSDIVGRLGGEEFGLLLPETDLPQALVVAERLRHQVENAPLTTPPRMLAVTISIGVAAAHQGVSGIADLMKRADHALYAAKRGGRNRVELADAGLANTEAALTPTGHAASPTSH